MLSVCGYAGLSVFNLFWLVHPRVGKLESILSGCERRSSKSVEGFERLEQQKKIGKGPEIRLDMYYDRYIF